MAVNFFSLIILCISLGLLGCESKSSFHLLVEKCESGDLRSCTDYLKLYSQSERPLSDPKVEKVLTKAAELGNSAAMFSLGVRATQPYTSPVDIKSAIHWFKKASVAGDSLASLNLGLIYDHGIGISSDLIQARHWYQKAADLGNSEGLFNFGVFLDEGIGGPMDKSAAARAYRLGAERGDARSAYNLALMMARGEGIDKNLDSALKMLERSQKLGYKPAQKLLIKWSQFERKGK